MADEKKRILCVDDDPDFLESIVLVLEGEGYDVRRASSAAEAREAYGERPPDLLIVDCMMEEVDSGVTFAKEVRAGGGTAPVIMLSAVGDGLAGSADTASLGLAGVLQKPFNPKVLLTLVRAKLK